MAEVLDCVDKAELEDLCNEIINNPIPCEEGLQYDKTDSLFIAES